MDGNHCLLQPSSRVASEQWSASSACWSHVPTLRDQQIIVDIIITPELNEANSSGNA